MLKSRLINDVSHYIKMNKDKTNVVNSANLFDYMHYSKSIDMAQKLYWFLTM